MAYDFTVTYDNGSTVEVHPGQREMADWEAQPFGCSALNAFDTKPITYFRYIAWSYLRRTGATTDAFKQWDAGVEDVKFTDPDTEAEAPGPTKQGRSSAA